MELRDAAGTAKSAHEATVQRCHCPVQYGDVILASRRKKVDDLNERVAAAIPGPLTTVEAVDRFEDGAEINDGTARDALDKKLPGYKRRLNLYMGMWGVITANDTKVHEEHINANVATLEVCTAATTLSHVERQTSHPPPLPFRAELGHKRIRARRRSVRSHLRR